MSALPASSLRAFLCAAVVSLATAGVFALLLQLRKARALIVHQRTKIAAQTVDWEAEKKQVKSLAAQCERLKDELDKNAHDFKSAQERSAALQAELKAEKARTDHYSDQLAQSKRENVRVNREIKVLKSSCERLEVDASHNGRRAATAEEQVADLRQENNRLQDEQSNAQVDIAAAKSLIDELSRSLQKEKVIGAELRTERDALKDVSEVLARQNSTLQQLFANSTEDSQRSKQELADLLQWKKNLAVAIENFERDFRLGDSPALHPLGLKRFNGGSRGSSKAPSPFASASPTPKEKEDALESSQESVMTCTFCGEEPKFLKAAWRGDIKVYFQA